jgi:hypothetical protein
MVDGIASKVKSPTCSWPDAVTLGVIQGPSGDTKEKLAFVKVKRESPRFHTMLGCSEGSWFAITLKVTEPGAIAR